MSTIIVPTDFSPVSINAVYYAADMACIIHADILLLHVVQLPLTIADVPLPQAELDKWCSDAETELQDLKMLLLKRCGDTMDIRTSVDIGSVITTIKNSIGRDTLAVVMGVQGAGAVERFLPGSNAFAAMQQLDCFVFLIPGDAQFKKPGKIGLACDMEERMLPIEAIEKIVNMFVSALHIIYVSRHGQPLRPEMLHEYLLLEGHLSHLKPSFHFVVNTDIEAGISEYAAVEQLDLLMIFPQKHSFPGSVFHKSISRGAVMHLHIPIVAHR